MGVMMQETYSNEEKKIGPQDHLRITLYSVICCVASMVSPDNVAVITPD